MQKDVLPLDAFATHRKLQRLIISSIMLRPLWLVTEWPSSWGEHYNQLTKQLLLRFVVE
jgi:hypothetical protein